MILLTTTSRSDISTTAFSVRGQVLIECYVFVVLQHVWLIRQFPIAQPPGSGYSIEGISTLIDTIMRVQFISQKVKCRHSESSAYHHHWPQILSFLSPYATIYSSIAVVCTGTLIWFPVIIAVEFLPPFVLIIVDLATSSQSWSFSRSPRGCSQRKPQELILICENIVC